MSITYLKRITGATNSLVQLNTTDSTAVALASGYLTAQAANIIAINDGAWTWEPNDLIILSASDGVSLVTINGAFSSLVSLASTLTPGHTFSTTFTLTAAQFDGMYAAPVPVIAAPGAGLIVVPEYIFMELVYGSAAFAAGGIVGFQYGASAHLAGTLATNTEAAADFFATANTAYNFEGAFGNGTQVLSSVGSNAAIYISNQTAAFTGGTGSVINGLALYRVIPIV